jgi:hypothetical protein
LEGSKHQRTYRAWKERLIYKSWFEVKETKSKVNHLGAFFFEPAMDEQVDFREYGRRDGNMGSSLFRNLRLFFPRCFQSVSHQVTSFAYCLLGFVGIFFLQKSWRKSTRTFGKKFPHPKRGICFTGVGVSQLRRTSALMLGTWHRNHTMSICVSSNTIQKSNHSHNKVVITNDFIHQNRYF